MGQGNHHETLIDTPPPLPSERSTGIVFAVVFLAAGILLRHHDELMVAALTASAATLATALLAPAWLAPLNRAWFKLALLLNRVISPVVMFVIYAGVIVPFGLVMQLLRDPLAAKRPERASHWIDRCQSSPTTSMRDQF